MPPRHLHLHLQLHLYLRAVIWPMAVRVNRPSPVTFNSDLQMVGWTTLEPLLVVVFQGLVHHLCQTKQDSSHYTQKKTKLQIVQRKIGQEDTSGNWKHK